MRLWWSRGLGLAMAAGSAALGLFLPARPARAQSVAYKASVTLTGAFTQSISESQFPTAQTFAGPSISVSPALIALIDTIRTENTLNYAFTLSVPFLIQANPGLNSAGVTYANRLTYSGRYALSERTSMTAGVGFTQTPINSFVASQDPTAAPIQTVPSGASYLLAASATEGVSHQVSERNIFTQSGSFIYGYPVDPTSERAQTYSATNSFALNHVFTRDTLGATLTTQLNYFTASQAAPTDTIRDQVPLPGSSAWVNTLAVNWQHPFTEKFSMLLIGGATQTLSPEAATFMQFQPTGSLGLSYNFLLATVGLSYAHQVQPNVALGNVNLSDVVSLRFAAPIGLTGLTTTGTVGYTHSVPLGAPVVACPGDASMCAVPSTVINPSDVYAADLGLDYHPERVPTLTVGLRGQLTRQVIAEDIVNTFTRYTVALNLTYSYPHANAAATRPQLQPLLSAQPPGASDVISTERYFSPGVSGPAPAEAPPLPKGP